MHMKATITGKQLARTIAVPDAEWRNLGNALRLRILTRTRARGVDADGASFAPYSEGYKIAKGKQGGMIGGGRVNLTGTTAGPKMLDTMMVTTQATINPRITISFALADKAQIAQYHMGEGRVDRLFFALGDDDVTYSVDYLRRRLQATT